MDFVDARQVRWPRTSSALVAILGVACGGAATRVPVREPPAIQQVVEPESAALEVASSGMPTVVFRGMCDASGAVALDGTRFAVGDDEDNLLRIYDTARGGDAVVAVDMSPALDLSPGDPTPEADIEAATKVGDRALWLTSHALSGSGEAEPSRFSFFASTVSADLSPVGTAYHNLLADMIADPALARFNLGAAARLPPRAAGGMNIEGMTRRLDGTSVLIGFRNPRPDDKALLVPLLNPLQVIEGDRAKFGPPQLLDLGGLGIRSLSIWRGRYLIIAGAAAHEAASRLYVWDGADALREVKNVKLDQINPEGFVSRDASDEVMLLSDDGTVELDGTPCKLLEDRARKQFRGVWVRVPEDL